MNKQCLILTGVLATGLVCAQSLPPPNGAGLKSSSSTTATLDESALFKSADTNHDGKVSNAEWRAAGLPAAVFSMADRNNTGSISLKDLNATTMPSGIDANHDGIISADEMKKYPATNGTVPRSTVPSRDTAPGVSPPAGTGLPPSTVPGSTVPGTVP